MDIFQDNIEKLKKSMQINKDKINSGRHTINAATPFLPFGTRNPERAKFKRKFLGVTGELVRLINEKKLSDEFDIKASIDDIVSVVECDDEDDLKYLKEVVREHLIDTNGNINVFDVKLFNYIKLTEGRESDGEKKIAQFLYDLFFSGEDEVTEAFNGSSKNSAIARLILHKLKGGLDNREVSNEYINNLSFVTEVAKEDFIFMAKNREYFLKNFQKLLSYYYFYYITQFSVILANKFNGNYEKPQELYYLLDSERAGRNRKSTNRGYKYIKNKSKNLLINMNIIEHLNFIFGVKGYNYEKIIMLFNSSSDEEKEKYLRTLKSWIEFYRNHFSEEPMELKLDLDELVNALEESLLERIDQATMSRYTLNIEEIGKRNFLKNRGGTYGYMLNITQEMILIITAVSIKEEKITLKALFSEYERRGLFLDSESKDVVVEILGKLNLIDKKSDSGDAQYVKGIL